MTACQDDIRWALFAFLTGFYMQLFSWMIGNSPKSDVNPALEAGLNAVFVPHAHTWVLENQEIRPGKGRLLVVERFADLRAHF